MRHGAFLPVLVFEAAVIAAHPLAALVAGAAEADPAKFDLEAVRRLVARNEALLARLKLEFTVKLLRTGVPPKAEGEAWRIPGRPFSHWLGTWAQDGARQRWTSEYFFAPGEAAGGEVHVTDGKVMQRGVLPDLMQGATGAPQDFHWGERLPTLLGLSWEGPRNPALSELLVPELAAQADCKEPIDGREAWVVTVKDPWPAGHARVWIDRERGVPLRVEHRLERPEDDQPRTTSLTEVKAVHRLPNGGWIPVAVKRSFPGAPDVQGQEIEVARESMSIAAAEFPESLFAIAFADGAKLEKAGFKDPGLNRRLELVRNRSLPDGYLEFLECSEPLGLEVSRMPGFPRYVHTRMIHDRTGRFWAHRVELRSCPPVEGAGVRVDVPDILNEEILVYDGAVSHQYRPREPEGKRLAIRGPLRRPEANHLRAIHGLPPALAAPFLSEEFIGRNVAHKRDGSCIYFIDDRYSVTARRDGFVTAALLTDWRLEGTQAERTPAGDAYHREVTITTSYRWRDDQGGKQRTRVKTTLKVLHASTGLVPPASLFDVPVPRGTRVQDDTREGFQFTYDWEERKQWQDGTPAEAPGGKAAPPLTVARWHNAPDGVKIGDGRITVLELWAHWCVPCIAGLKQLEEYSRRHRGPRVQFVAIHSAEMPPEKLAAVIRNVGITFPVAQDAPTGEGSWATFEAFGAGAYPSLFVIDGEGRVSERFESVEPAIERVETLPGKKAGR